MKFAHFFVERPIFASVMSIVVLLVGGISFAILPVAQYPEIVPPTIQVNATYPGANAETVAATVATVIEQEINGVENMLYMTSNSSTDGSMSLQIAFRIGTNLDQANVLVQNRVAIALPKLPAEVRNLGVTTRKRSPDLLLVVHMLSPDESYDQLYISNYSLIRVRDQLLRLDGVGDITVFGVREYSLRVWLQPDKLSAYALTTTDVVSAMQEQNVQVAGGALGAPPAASDNAFQLVVQTQGRFSNPRQFSEIIIKSADGRLVRLGDVANIELAARDYTTNSFLNGKPAIGIGVYQRPGTNALQASDDVIAKMEEIKRDFPKGIDYRIAYNPTEFVRESANAVYRTLFEALLLVVLVVVVFLQSWRTAIIPIVAIPISLIGTFAFMVAFGFSLNNLTLFGLVLAIGVVVDDAIVFVENVERNIQAGMSPGEAAHKTIDEVGTAIIAIGLVLLAVFVPTAFVPGITGQFYRQFALTIASSTIISTFVSLTLSPALCALLLKPHDAHRRPRFFLFRWLHGLGDGFNWGFGKSAGGYAATVRGITGRRALLLGGLLIFAGLGYATAWITKRVPVGFIPAQDTGYLLCVVQLPDGASLTRTNEVMRRVSKLVQEAPGVADSVEIVGISGATFTATSSQALLFTPLKPFAERRRQGLTSDVIAADLVKRLSVIREATIFAQPPPPVRGLGTSGGFKMQVQDRSGVGLQSLLAASRDLVSRSLNENRDKLERVFTTFGVNTPQIYLEIDRTKARMLNVPLANVFNTIQVNLGGAYVNDFNAFGRVYQVRAQAEESFRDDRERILRLKVRSATGDLVPLGSLVAIKDVAGPDLVQRFNMFATVPVQGQTQKSVSSGTGLDIMESAARNVLPEGIGYEWTELAYQERAAGNTSVYIFALSVLFVFLVLAALYESWALPLAIILIVPMSVLAAMVGILLRGMDNNILTQVGFVVLIGLASKNAILIVEFARQAEEEGMGRVAAVVHAARLRLRPILMTAFAFILGVVPLVVATGPGAEMRQALGTAVFAGMLGVTFFGLFLTPIFYVAIRNSVDWLRRRRGSGQPAHAPAE
jgi:HAE1 family hydrophobic/amphiphilic exporter-1